MVVRQPNVVFQWSITVAQKQHDQPKLNDVYCDLQVTHLWDEPWFACEECVNLLFGPSSEMVDETWRFMVVAWGERPALIPKMGAMRYLGMSHCWLECCNQPPVPLVKIPKMNGIDTFLWEFHKWLQMFCFDPQLYNLRWWRQNPQELWQVLVQSCCRTHPDFIKTSDTLPFAVSWAMEPTWNSKSSANCDNVWGSSNAPETLLGTPHLWSPLGETKPKNSGLNDWQIQSLGASQVGTHRSTLSRGGSNCCCRWIITLVSYPLSYSLLPWVSNCEPESLSAWFANVQLLEAIDNGSSGNITNNGWLLGTVLYYLRTVVNVKSH